MKSITSIELANLLRAKVNIQLIDVREPYEHEEFDIGGELVPLSQILQSAEKIEKEKPVVMYCRQGIRSQIAIQRLEKIFPYKNLVNLTGGMDDWKKQFPA